MWAISAERGRNMDQFTKDLMLNNYNKMVHENTFLKIQGERHYSYPTRPLAYYFKNQKTEIFKEYGKPTDSKG